MQYTEKLAVIGNVAAVFAMTLIIYVGWYEIWLAPCISTRAVVKIHGARTRTEVEQRLTGWDATPCTRNTAEGRACMREFPSQNRPDWHVYKYSKGSSYIAVYYDAADHKKSASDMD
jgi:hypothetical protein